MEQTASIDVTNNCTAKVIHHVPVKNHVLLLPFHQHIVDYTHLCAQISIVLDVFHMHVHTHTQYTKNPITLNTVQ
jgi:hypothetical protein